MDFGRAAGNTGEPGCLQANGAAGRSTMAAGVVHFRGPISAPSLAAARTSPAAVKQRLRSGPNASRVVHRQMSGPWRRVHLPFVPLPAEAPCRQMADRAPRQRAYLRSEEAVRRKADVKRTHISTRDADDCATPRGSRGRHSPRSFAVQGQQSRTPCSAPHYQLRTIAPGRPGGRTSRAVEVTAGRSGYARRCIDAIDDPY